MAYFRVLRNDARVFEKIVKIVRLYMRLKSTLYRNMTFLSMEQ